MPDIIKLQRTLAQVALSHPNKRFNDLYGLVRNPEWLSTALASVLHNDGAQTAGIDGITKNNLEDESKRQELVSMIAQRMCDGTYRPQPVRRVYIPKTNGKLRPLGIPTITDRMVQEALRMVIEPIYESKFLPCSYGFRPRLSTMDAIKQLQLLVDKNHRYYWLVEGDIKGCFDNIPHKLLLATLEETIEDRKIIRLVRHMLAAGYVEKGRIYTPNCGTPQGGIVSPLFANIYLHKMDAEWQRRYRSGTAWERVKIRRTGKGLVQLVRYADDFLLLTNGTEDQANDLKEEFRQILVDMGLELSAEKTLVTHINDGVNFLGFTMRRQQMRKRLGRYAVYVRPTEKNVVSLKAKVNDILATTDKDVVNTIRALNMLLTGWANYYRHVASYRERTHIQNWLYHHFYGWLHKKHGHEKTYEELWDLYRKVDRRGWKNWGCEGIFLVVLPRDIRFKRYLREKRQHPYLACDEKSQEITIQEETPLPVGTWDGKTTQNRYAVVRLQRIREVGYRCEECKRGPYPANKLHAHHPMGKQPDTWQVIQILCEDCHKKTASFGRKKDS